MDTASGRILITGANGFVGRHLIAYLLATEAAGAGPSRGGERGDAPPARVVAAVGPEHVAEAARPVSPALGAAGWAGGTVDGRLEVVGLDVCDMEVTQELMAQVQPQYIVHLAARASGADADREAVFAVNVAGTRNLLEAAARLSPFPRVLLASTGYVYGDTDPARPAREEDPVGPLWRYGPYTDSKIEMESIARSYRGFALVARAFAHTGPGQTERFAAPGFARQLARIERGLEPPQLRVGNLDARRDLLDVRDVVRAYSLLLEQGAPGETYNIALGQPVRIGDLLDRLRSLCAVPTEVTLDPARLRPADITCSTGDSFRLWTATGWKPRYPLDATLRDTLDYWRAEVARSL